MTMADVIAAHGTSMHHATHLGHATVDRSVVHLGTRVFLSTTTVVRRTDHDGEPVHVEVEVANIAKDDGQTDTRGSDFKRHARVPSRLTSHMRRHQRAWRLAWGS